MLIKVAWSLLFVALGLYPLAFAVGGALFGLYMLWRGNSGQLVMLFGTFGILGGIGQYLLGNWSGVLWCLGVTLMGLLVLQGSRFLISRASRTYAAWGIVLGLAIHTALAVFERFSRESQGMSGESLRVFGLVGHHNLLGHLAVVDAGAILLLAGAKLGAVGLLLAFVLVWLSETRGALLGLLLLLPLWVAMAPRAWRWGALGGILAALLPIALWGTPTDWGRFSTIFDPEYGTTQYRLELSRAIIKTIPSKLWTGFGIGHLPIEIEQRFGATHGHSLPIGIVADGGLLLFLGFLLLWGGLTFTLVSKRAWGGLMLLLTVSAMNLTDYTLFNANVYYPLWVGLAAELFSSDRIL